MPQNVGKIGELLIERGKLTRKQLDAALRNQGFFREHLGTTLFKMGFVDEETLGVALSELASVPYAPPAMFENLPASLVSLLPTKLAEKHDVVPLKLEGRKLHLAMLNPRDLLVLDEIAFITGYTIQPWIAPEFRLYDALERNYNVVSKRRRTITLSGSGTFPVARGAPRRERSRTASETAPIKARQLARASSPPAPPAAPAAPAAPELGLDGRPLDALPEIGPPLPPIHEPESPPAEPALRDMRSLEEAGRALQQAETRDDVAEAVLGYAGAHLKRVALFILQKERVIGWSGRGQGVVPERIKELQLSLRSPSIFSALGNGKMHYLGGVPDNSSNRELYRVLGGSPPDFILLAPINIKGRAVAALYADDGGGPLSSQLEDLLKLGRMAAIALEILILRTKIMMA
ncbi:MAG: hypothetical protein V3U98_06410 [Acidobacteriota bacterium]